MGMGHSGRRKIVVNAALFLNNKEVRDQ